MPAINWDKQKTKKHRYLVYGIPGVGKTTLSSFMKGKTYMLSLDQSFYRIKFWQGKKDIWVIDPDQPIEDLTEFVKSFKPENYDNLIIDNMSNFQKLWFAEKAKETKSGLDNKMSDYSEINNYTIQFISKAFTWDLNILVTAWEKRDKVTDANGQEFEQYAPDFRPDPRDFLMGNCDVVARMIQKPQTGERGLIMQSDPGTYAKNRLDKRPGCKAEEFFND